ncbi:hypothetical protein BC829DRAFT_430680 [Chytridium lagenaria]|nr:hypothetical protein BC829DRAFT_430680 [Chytridium lagenaria]
MLSSSCMPRLKGSGDSFMRDGEDPVAEPDVVGGKKKDGYAAADSIGDYVGNRSFWVLYTGKKIWQGIDGALLTTTDDWTVGGNLQIDCQNTKLSTRRIITVDPKMERPLASSEAQLILIRSPRYSFVSRMISETIIRSEKRLFKNAHDGEVGSSIVA